MVLHFFILPHPSVYSSHAQFLIRYKCFFYANTESLSIKLYHSIFFRREQGGVEKLLFQMMKGTTKLNTFTSCRHKRDQRQNACGLTFAYKKDKVIKALTFGSIQCVVIPFMLGRVCHRLLYRLGSELCNSRVLTCTTHVLTTRNKN